MSDVSEVEEENNMNVPWLGVVYRRPARPGQVRQSANSCNDLPASPPGWDRLILRWDSEESHRS